MPEPVALKTVNRVNPEPNEQCINMLREALKLAKTGEVRGVALCLAVVDPESVTKDGSRHMVSWEGPYKNALFTGVDVMKFSMMHEAWEEVQKADRTKLTDEDE